MTQQTIFLKDYQAPTFKINTIDLSVNLYDDHAIIHNDMHITRTHAGELYLHGDELELLSISLNQQLLSEEHYHLSPSHLIINNCPDDCHIQITTRIRPQDNSKLSGLYRSNQLFCTQCEAEGFRRITFFPDRPDVLTVFSTRISADKAAYPILLSNGNLIESGESDDGRHWVLWQDPFKKPSYLFALVAGNLAYVQDEFITQSGRRIDLRIYVELGNEDKCAHALSALKKAMRWDEEKFGREYDLDILMIVAVSDFNMGAMENKGLNIFNAKYILARPDTATDDDYAGIESVVAHEYFHNWTGNRITCRDWFQLSLKEGLTVFRDQEFSRDMNSREVNRINDVKTLRQIQFPEDAGSMAHPVRPESYQEINNFYTATVYNKGAEVIRMQQTLLGHDGFRRGMDLYFQRHDGQAVTIDDFVKAMEDANGVDFGQFKRWYTQARTPEVNVISEYTNGHLSLTFTQSCPPSPECMHKEPFHIPIRIALFDTDGQTIPIPQDVLELRETTQTIHIDNLKAKPIISFLRDFSAPVLLTHINESDEDLRDLLRVERNGFAKWDAAQRLVRACINDCDTKPDTLWHIPEPLLTTFQQILTDESLDSALRAALITPPSFEETIATKANIDVDAIEAVRDFYRLTLGRALWQSAHRLYQTLWQQEDHAMHGHAYGRRRLRNLCLWLMMKGDEAAAIPICQHQFIHAKTMTDQIASLLLLINSNDISAREQALSRFYQQWQGNDLVLDKWFSLQATSEAANTLQQVQTLLTHPAFSLKNPNKVRALIGSFCQANPRHFHAKDGSGYVFLTKMLLTIDPINPQITARLAVPFTRKQRLDNTRQRLITEQLDILDTHSLSRDLRELVSKSLKA
jgi:aminopeptidase N